MQWHGPAFYRKKEPKDFRSDLEPTWCKGCTYFSVLSALTRTFAEKQFDPTHLCVVSGIGCSSRLPLWLNAFGMHTLHGRAIPIALGVRMVQPDLPVIVVGGDGDLFSIGIGHFVHAARKNINMTVLSLDNRLYAMTKNQSSPTSPMGHHGTLTPCGKLSHPLNTLGFAISCGATLVAQTVFNDVSHIAQLLSRALDHEGFSFLNILAPCGSYAKENIAAIYRDKTVDINKDIGHDCTSKEAALAFILSIYNHDASNNVKIPIGLFFEDKSRPTFGKQVERMKAQYVGREAFSIKSILDNCEI